MHLLQRRSQGQQTMFQPHLLWHPLERLCLHKFQRLFHRTPQQIRRNAAGQRICRIDQFLAVVCQHMRRMNLTPQQIPLYLSRHPVPAPRMQCLETVLVVVHDDRHIAYAVGCHRLEDSHALADKLRCQLMHDLHRIHVVLS